MRAETEIAQAVEEHGRALHAFFAEHTSTIESLAVQIAACFKQGGKLLLCGNGGSTCDAMHIAGEFVGRFKQEREGLPAIALTADSGILTAVGNDYGFARVFSRQVEALGRKGDMLVALSTSGSSENVVEAIRAAKARWLTTVLLTGAKGKGNLAGADLVLAVPHTDTARIQEVHITALHILSDRVETMLFGKGAA